MARSLVLGHRGLVGQALMRKMPDSFTGFPVKTDRVYLAAARVGGIGTNVETPADMIADNIEIQLRCIQSCTDLGAKLLFIGSSCIYPRDATCPIPESALMTGPLEPTNSAYAMAKLAGLEMCKAHAKQYGLRYVALMPCNLYGPGRPNDTHVVNMLMRRFHEAKLSGVPCVTVWGSGAPLRELMHVDDLAEAAVYFMNMPEAEGQIINVGTGYEITIRDLAILLARIVDYRGDIVFDSTKPDGVYRKVLDVSLARSLGWEAKTPLRVGLSTTYEWYVNNGGWQ